MLLYLCRHAEAVESAGDPPIDEERWLTEHGRNQALTVGHALQGQGVRFDHLFTSRLVRAVQTAETLAFALHRSGPVGVMRSLAPGGRLSKVLSSLQEMAAAEDHVALV